MEAGTRTGDPGLRRSAGISCLSTQRPGDRSSREDGYRSADRTSERVAVIVEEIGRREMWRKRAPDGSTGRAESDRGSLSPCTGRGYDRSSERSEGA